jgi:hypothetical protein
MSSFRSEPESNGHPALGGEIHSTLKASYFFSQRQGLFSKNPPFAVVSMGFDAGDKVSEMATKNPKKVFDKDTPKPAYSPVYIGKTSASSLF